MGVASASIKLLLRNSQSNLLSVWCCDESSLLFCGRQSRRDGAKSHRVASDTECWSPLFCNRLRESSDTGLGEGVVGLAGIAVNAGGGGDVDDAAWLAVLDTEVWGGGANELEGSSAVEVDDRVPLLVGCLAMSVRSPTLERSSCHTL